MSTFFLSSGLFLGWSLGANDAANVFGTAVGSRMVSFRTAAIIASVFILLGAVLSGAGATETLGKLGAVHALAGAFVVAGSAALSVFLMSRLRIPVSTSQAIVGAIVGWNLFNGIRTDQATLTKILGTWVLCPIFAGLFAVLIFMTFRTLFNKSRIHLLRLDLYIRLGLLIVGAFGAYSLGANNIANVMGVFVNASPFHDLRIANWCVFTGKQQLFFFGGVAISVGVFTYSRKVMETVGKSLFRLSPEAALVVVLAHGIVLFVFASSRLEQLLLSLSLPTFPLVPVSSTQAVVGAILGVGLIKGAREINYNVLGEIAIGWIVTPIAAGIIAFLALFFLQNVFEQDVSRHLAQASQCF